MRNYDALNDDEKYIYELANIEAADLILEKIVRIKVFQEQENKRISEKEVESDSDSQFVYVADATSVAMIENVIKALVEVRNDVRSLRKPA